MCHLPSLTIFFIAMFISYFQIMNQMNMKVSQNLLA